MLDTSKNMITIIDGTASKSGSSETTNRQNVEKVSQIHKLLAQNELDSECVDHLLEAEANLVATSDKVPLTNDTLAGMIEDSKELVKNSGSKFNASQVSSTFALQNKLLTKVQSQSSGSDSDDTDQTAPEYSIEELYTQLETNVESLGAVAASMATPETPYELLGDQISAQFSRQDAGVEQKVSFEYTSGKTSQITIPATLTSSLGSNIKVDLQTIIKKYNNNAALASTTYTSDILSLKLFTIETNSATNTQTRAPIDVKDSSSQILFTIPITQASTSLNLAQKTLSCVYWDPQRRLWLSNGVSTSQITLGDNVSCSTNHLTEFGADLIDVIQPAPVSDVAEPDSVFDPLYLTVVVVGLWIVLFLVARKKDGVDYARVVMTKYGDYQRVRPKINELRIADIRTDVQKEVVGKADVLDMLTELDSDRGLDSKQMIVADLDSHRTMEAYTPRMESNRKSSDAWNRIEVSPRDRGANFRSQLRNYDRGDRIDGYSRPALDEDYDKEDKSFCRRVWDDHILFGIFLIYSLKFSRTSKISLLLFSTILLVTISGVFYLCEIIVTEASEREAGFSAAISDFGANHFVVGFLGACSALLIKEVLVFAFTVQSINSLSTQDDFKEVQARNSRKLMISYCVLAAFGAVCAGFNYFICTEIRDDQTHLWTLSALTGIAVFLFVLEPVKSLLMTLFKA